MTFIGNNQFSFKTPEDRYWSKVEKKPAPECWEWKGHKNIDGHGRFILKKKGIMAYRYAWELEFGEIPNGLQVLHRCDNAGCVNPAHLFLGTQIDNIMDAKNKGHYKGINAGELGGLAKLTWNDVHEIRRRYHKGDGYRRLAKEFGVSSTQIGNVVKHKTWKEKFYQEKEVTGSG